MASTSVTFRLFGDPKGALKAFNQVESAGSKMSDKLKGLLPIAGVAGLGAVAGQAFNLAAELDGLAKKSSTVFEGSLDEIETWAKGVNKQFGLSSNEVVGLATNMGDLLKPMGFNAEQAAAMSQETVGLAGALSEWSGGTLAASDVSDILTKAMLGETDGLKAVGIAISAAEIEQRALALAQADGRDEITAMDKALATQELVFEKSTDAQTAYAEGGNKLLRAQNNLKATFKDLRDRVVTALIPAFMRLVEIGGQVVAWAKENKDVLYAVGGAVAFIAGAAVFGKLFQMLKLVKGAVMAFNLVLAANPIGVAVVALAALGAGLYLAYQRSETFRAIVDRLFEIVKQFATVVVEAAKAIYGGIVWLIDTIKPAWTAFWSAFGRVLSDGIEKTKAVFSAGWNAVKETVSTVFGAIQTIISRYIAGYKALISGALLVITTAWNAAWGLFGGTVSAVWEGIKTVAKGGVNVVIGYINTLIRAWNGLDFTFGGVDLGPLGSIPSVTLGLPDIPTVPRLASGSVAAPNRPFLAMLGDNRREHEVVSPVSTMREAFRAELAAGGGGSTIVVQIGDTVLDRVLVDSLGRIRRTQGRVV